jgi:nitroreductase
MDKAAPADHPIHEIIRDRWSPRAFGEEGITRPALLSLFEAARWAPSAYNDQPWYFMIAMKEDRKEFERMLGCLVDANQAWARDAAMLAIAVARLNYGHNGKPYRHAHYDTGQAVMSMVLQATALGIRAHQMAGFDPEEARETYGIPEGHEALTAIALGYPGDTDRLPDKLRQSELAERTRRPLTETLFTGAWGRGIQK